MYFTNGTKYFHTTNESCFGNKIEGEGISEFYVYDKSINYLNLLYSKYTFNKTEYKIISKEEYLSVFSNKVKELLIDLNGECFKGLMGMYLYNKTNLIWVNASTYEFDIDTSRNVNYIWKSLDVSNLDFIKYLMEGYTYYYL